MKTLVILLSLIALAAAKMKTYKGLQSVNVGKKTYKCNLNIQYSTSPPKCGKVIAKCKPLPKKAITVSVSTGDATISFQVVKKKYKDCTVEAGGESTSSPSPGGGGSGGGGNSPTPGGGSGNSPIPPIFTLLPPGPGNAENMNCNCRLPLLQPPPAVALRNIDLGHAIARMLVDAKDRVKPEKTAASAVQRTFTLPALPTIPADLTSLIPVLLIAFVSVIIGILKGMLLSSAPLATGRSLVDAKEMEQARILSKLLDRQGLEGILGGILGGANGGGGDNGGLLGALLGGAGGGGANGGFEEAIMSTIIQNMIDQILANPESLQEMITLAVNSGVAEQVITNLIESGDIATLVQSLVDSGAGPDIIGNLGNGLLQELLNNNELGDLNIDDLTQMLEEALGGMGGGVENILAGVDVQNMELNMQCSCVKDDPSIFPIPGK